MNSLIKSYITFLAGFVILFAVTTPVFAGGSTDCQPIYGGGASCQQSEKFNVDLQVKHPQNNTYANSFGPKDALFAPGQQVTYKILIKNTGKNELTKLPVKTFFPQLITYTQGSGNYDTKNRSLSFSIDKLKPNETKVFFVQASVVEKDKLPSKQQIQCALTQTLITLDKEQSQDNTQVCINPNAQTVLSAKTNPPTTKGGLPVHQPTQTKTTPGTGPETFALISLLPMAGAGWYLRRIKN